MATSVGSGSQSCTISTEHTLDTETTAGTFQLYLDFANAVKGDVFVVRHKLKVLSGSTAAEIAGYTIDVANDLEASTVVACPPVASLYSLAVTIQQTAGTGRTIDWNLVQVDA